MSRYDDDDDRPARKSNNSSKRRYEDDEDEDERPTRRSRARDDDDEDERPARRSRRDEDEDEDERPAKRRSRDEDDDDEIDRRPAKRRSRDEDDDKPKRQPARTLKRGWGAADKVKSATSTFANRLKPSTDPQLIKFLEDDPYVSFAQHWIKRSGQQSFTCIADEDPKGCPLCNAGDTAAGRICFNVAIINIDGDEEAEPILASLEASSAVSEQIKNFHKDPKTGPISKHYWSYKKASDKQTANILLNPVKERDLAEDWDASPITDKQLRALEKDLYTPAMVKMPSRRELQEIAAEEYGD